MTDTVNVPRDPTLGMIHAAERVGNALAGSDASSGEMIAAVWTAMLAAAPKAEPVEADDFGDALLAFLFRHGLKVALDVSEIEALRQSAIRAQPEAPKVEQGPVGWLLPDAAQDWQEYILTDGENVAIAQRAETDHGGMYWSIEGGSGGIDWEPTLIAPWPPTTHPAASSDELLKALQPFAYIASHVGLPRDETVHLTSLDGKHIATIYRNDFWRAADLLAKHKGPQS